MSLSETLKRIIQWATKRHEPPTPNRPTRAQIEQLRKQADADLAKTAGQPATAKDRQDQATLEALTTVAPAATREILADSRTLEGAERFRQRKTTSVLAIVFTDIANSTALRERLGEVGYERYREHYDADFTRIIEADEAGAVVKSTGDGALAVFSEPSTAVERCLMVQQDLGNHPHFRLRVGIDMGQVTVKSAKGIVKDVFGRHVNRAARIEALADPGHILTSFSVFDSAVGWLKEGSVRWHTHGVVPLKGFDGLISIHEAYDSSCRTPQSSEGFPKTDEVRFSRVPSADVPVMFSLAEQRPASYAVTQWSALEDELRTRPFSIRPITFVKSNDPYADYLRRLTETMQSLKDLGAKTPTVLWVGRYPPDTSREFAILRKAGYMLDVMASIESARDKIRAKKYLLLVIGIETADDTAAARIFVKSRKAERIAAPVFVYGSPQAIASYDDQADGEDSIFSTAGTITLLDGIHQVLRGYVARILRIT